MIINQLDLGGSSNPWLKPIAGQMRGEVMVEGAEDVAYPRGSVLREFDQDVWVHAWQALGGQVAGSFGAARYFLKQLEELASNPFMNPAFIQWSATADPTGYNSPDPHDGWYTIDDFEPDYSSFIVSGYVKVHMKATWIATGPPRTHFIAYAGGPLSSNFSGTALNLISLPIGSTPLEASFTRTGAEGAIPCILSPVASPEPFVPAMS